MLRFLKQFLKERVQFGSDFGDFQCMKKKQKPLKATWNLRIGSWICDLPWGLILGAWSVQGEAQLCTTSHHKHQRSYWSTKSYDILWLCSCHRKTIDSIPIAVTSTVSPQVAGVNTPSGVFGDHSNMVPHVWCHSWRGPRPLSLHLSFGKAVENPLKSEAWKGTSVSLGSHDFLQQQDADEQHDKPNGRWKHDENSCF